MHAKRVVVLERGRDATGTDFPAFAIDIALLAIEIIAKRARPSAFNLAAKPQETRHPPNRPSVTMASNITPCVSHPSFLSHWAPNPSTERGDNLVLGTHPKEPKIIYPSGKFIVVRDVTNPTDVFVYRGHNSKTTVAKFSPNGFWVASADITGKVCIQL